MGTVAHEVPTVSVHSHQLPGHCIQHRRRGCHKTSAQTLSQQSKQSCGKRRNPCHRHRTCSHRLVQASAHNGASETGITGMLMNVTYRLGGQQVSCFSRALYAGTDLAYLTRAAELADSSAGQYTMPCQLESIVKKAAVTGHHGILLVAGVSQPHPNSGCVLVSATGIVLAETYLAAQVRVTACREGACPHGTCLLAACLRPVKTMVFCTGNNLSGITSSVKSAAGVSLNSRLHCVPKFRDRGLSW